MKTKLLILGCVPFICGCAVMKIDELGLDRTPPVSHKDEFWKIPCIWDGTRLDKINEKLIPKNENIN